VARGSARSRCARRASTGSKSTKRFERRLKTPAARAIVVGDSTALGTGAGRAANSIPGLLASAYPEVSVVTHARVGACIEDVPAQLAAAPAELDVVQMGAGGNDVFALTPSDKLSAHAETAIAEARARAPLVIVAGAANIGAAPMFFWPLRSWLARRTARVRDALADACARYGAHYVDFFRGKRDRFSAEPSRYFAADHLHPSMSSYRVCFDEMRKSTPLDGVRRRLPLSRKKAARKRKTYLSVCGDR
jgi:lysophospholipase L1-like esterase